MNKREIKMNDFGGKWKPVLEDLNAQVEMVVEVHYLII